MIRELHTRWLRDGCLEVRAARDALLREVRQRDREEWAAVVQDLATLTYADADRKAAASGEKGLFA